MFALVAVYALPSFIGLGKAPEAQASMSDYYLKIEGVDGESMVKNHEKSIQVLGFSFGASRPTTPGGGMSAGKVVFQDLHITKMIDKATPMLFQACASNKMIPKMSLSVVKTSPDKVTTYMTYTFVNIGCSSFTNSADPLVEEVSFTYQKINIEYTPFDEKGAAGDKVISGWDLKANKSV